MEEKLHIKYVKEAHGVASYMVIYQAIDGRVEIEYLETHVEAVHLCKELRLMGQKPKLWRALEW